MRSSVGRGSCSGCVTRGNGPCVVAPAPSSSVGRQVPAVAPWRQHSQRRWRGRVPKSGMPGPLTAAPASLSATESSTLLVADHAQAAGGATLVLQLTGHLAAVDGGAEVIDLAPLETPHVREIVADYVSPDVVDVVTEEVERRSGGWPGAVHDAAIDAARERAMRRVEVAAAATGASTSQLASARAELADNVALLQDTTTVLEPADPGDVPVARPGRVRRRGRAMVRRPRAPRRRAGCPAGRYQAARPGRCLRFGEVLGATGRTPGGTAAVTCCPAARRGPSSPCGPASTR